MAASLKVFVPRLMDSQNNNAQNLNAKALLSRFTSEHQWISAYYFKPLPHFRYKKHIRLNKLLPRHAWRSHLFSIYQKKYDAIFYPGVERFEYNALRLRALFNRKVPIISTLEGFLGNQDLEKRYSQWAGHSLYCQHVDNNVLARATYLYEESKHIVAISPLIEKIGRHLYGDKITLLPLGVDLNVFYPAKTKTSPFTVIGAGRLYQNKQPQLFVELAQYFPNTQFIWYGDGELRIQLKQILYEKKITNLSFPGSISNEKLAHEFRKAHLFVLPSLSEGWSKVLHEAVACGLPAIAFGFYEPLAIINDQNGYIVWNKAELFEQISQLISNPEKAQMMGAKGAKLAKAWDWEKIAPLWEKKIISIISD